MISFLDVTNVIVDVVKILPPSLNKQLHIVQQDRQELVARLAARHGITLDYTDASMQDLDRLLERMLAVYAAEGIPTEDLPKSQGVKDVCELLGFYIAECIERNYAKGVWLEQHPDTKRPGLCLKVKSRIVTPADWAMASLTGNSSVWQAYSTFVTA